MAESANGEGFSSQQLSVARDRLAPLSYKRFIPEGQPANPPTELNPGQVEANCFRVLGYLEEYYRPGRSKSEIKPVATGEPQEPGKHDKRGELRSLERQLDGLLSPHDAGGSVDSPSDDPSHKEAIKQKLGELLSNPQVRERFEAEFERELPHFQAARKPMKEVRDIDRVTEKLRIAIYRSYLSDKHDQGKLTQSGADQIGFFQEKLDELVGEKEGVEDTATEATLGYLETQKLLEYKKQMHEKGFALTPSRWELIDRISREAIAGKKIFLVGSTGTGKTQLGFYALNSLTGGYELINWHEGTTPRDLFGYRELWTDEEGGVQSGMKPGPIPKGLEREVGVLHEEYTGGSTRTQLAAKFMMGARPGEHIQIPGFNGQVFDVTNNFVEIFTGNPKDERTKQREDMDPAILRELTGVEVGYMDAQEMNDIIRAQLVEENGILKLGQSELRYVKQLTKAAEMMQRIHNRDFDGFSPEIKTLLGIDPQGNTETALNTNFLDPGTLFKLFSEWELARARGQSFQEYMGKKLSEFVNDPKTLSHPEEKKTIQKVLHSFGLIKNATSDVVVVIESVENREINSIKARAVTEGRPLTAEEEATVRSMEEQLSRGYVLPSEMAGAVTQSKEDPMGGKQGEKGVNPNIESAKRLFSEDFFGPDAVKKAFGVELSDSEIPEITFSQQELERAKELGQRLILRVDRAQDRSVLTMNRMQKLLQEEFSKDPKKGKVLFDTSWYKDEAFFNAQAPRMKWALVGKDVLPGSTGKHYLDQTIAINDYLVQQVLDGPVSDEHKAAIADFRIKRPDLKKAMDEVLAGSGDWQKLAKDLSELRLNQMFRQTPAEVLYDMLMVVQNTEGRFLPDKYTWTNGQSRVGRLVNVGRSDAEGARVLNGHPHYADGALGVVFSR